MKKMLGLLLMTTGLLAGCQTTEDIDFTSKDYTCTTTCRNRYDSCQGAITMMPIRKNNDCVDNLRFCIAQCPPKGSPVIVPSNDASNPSKVSMDDAKRKCLDLGFKVGTESFGQCVLKVAQ
jgi:hypothetical protein